MPNVVESPHVGVLMDIGQYRMAIESDALKAGASRFGEGYHDFINGSSQVPREDWFRVAAQIMEQDKEAWASIVRASLLVVQSSENDQELKKNLTHLATIVVAWLEDVNGRTLVGQEP